MSNRARAGLLVLVVLLLGAVACPAAVMADVAPDPGSVVVAPSPAAQPSGEAPALYALLALLPVFLIPLALTLAIEVPVVVLFGRDALRRTATAAVLANTLTNPLLVGVVLLIAPYLGTGRSGVAALLTLEAIVIVAEWRLYAWVLGWSSGRAFAAALTANALSFGIGMLLGFDGGLGLVASPLVHLGGGLCGG